MVQIYINKKLIYNRHLRKFYLTLRLYHSVFRNTHFCCPFMTTSEKGEYRFNTKIKNINIIKSNLDKLEYNLFICP